MGSKTPDMAPRHWVSSADIGFNQSPVTDEQIKKMREDYAKLGIFRDENGKAHGKFVVRKEGNRACWYVLGTCSAKQIREIVIIAKRYGRDIHINTGGKLYVSITWYRSWKCLWGQSTYGQIE